MEPNLLPLSFLEYVTNEFSETRKVGSGGYGEVYKGVDRNGKEIAVKKLYMMVGLDDEQFMNEFRNLIRLQHRNVVRFIGYCNEDKYKFWNINGEYIFGKMIYKALCFEYLQNGSLDKHLYEESHGFDWLTRYKIIKGICEGLNYLHVELEKPILHLDLKPANILLDDNMVPKIADFGLSRLFSGTRSYATQVCRGSQRYMPPEYLQKKIISNKNDVFSLGMIIIEIMTGPNGYTKYAESSPQEFVELVHKNWKERIGATSNYTEQDNQQVKRCIEIAVKCVETDRKNRPNTTDIIRQLRETEINRTTSSSDHASVYKIGPWGGVGGGLFDVKVAPHLLENLIIGSGEVIYSIEFSYRDCRGNKHIAGPWGGYGPQKATYHHTIQLSRSEYVTEVAGTIGPFPLAQAGVITSLTIITNVSSYGPFGKVRGTPFQIPVQSDSGIVGFFTHAGYYMDAFGIYVNPNMKVTDGKEEALLAKIGPWGGNGGMPCDINVAPYRLLSMTIQSDIVVYSLEFSYLDHVGQMHTAGPWGSRHGRAHTIQFGTSEEFVTGVFGTTGQFNDSQCDVVTSLTLVTNARTYGPFGHGQGTSFQISMHDNGSVVGFFGHAESYLYAMGIYAKSEQEPIEKKAGLTKLGPWGGRQGIAHDIGTTPQPQRLERVIIHGDAVIHSLEFSYSDLYGRQHSVGPWGGPGGNVHQIPLQPFEFLQGISGTFGPYGTFPNVITSIAFATNLGRSYGPYGQGGGTPFNILVGREQRDGCIVGFFGHAESYLEAIGVYVHKY